MAVNACDICGCIPVSMDDRFFYQAAINLLCDISTNTAGGGGGGGDVNLTQVGGVAIALGQAAMAASLPVVLASNQTAIPVTTVIPGTAATNLGKAHNAALSTGDTGVASWAVRDDTNSQVTTTNGRYQPLIVDNLNGLKVATAQRTTFTHTQPTFTTATSFSLLAANTARRYLLIQNNSAANIMISLNNGTLTGIVPTSTNLGIVLAPNTAYESPPNAVPTAAITGYQTSGGSINTVTVVEA